MIKRMVMAIVAVFVLWSVSGFVIHNLILGGAYQQTAALWRPMAEMKVWLIYICRLISAIVFVAIYARLVGQKSMLEGVIYGLLFGLGTGFAMGFGTYATIPITPQIALGWFLGTVVETTLAGWLIGAIVRESPAPAAT
jgi:hypothetical protein